MMYPLSIVIVNGAATGRSNSIYATTAAYCRLRHSDAHFFAVFCRVFSSPVLRDILMQIFDVAYGRLHGATIRYKKIDVAIKKIRNYFDFIMRLSDVTSVKCTMLPLIFMRLSDVKENKKI